MRKKFGKMMVTSMILGVSMMLGGCGKKATMEEVLLEYMALIPQEKYESMYEMIDVSLSDSVEKEFFVERNSKIYEGMQIENFKVNIIEVNKEEGSVTYQTSFDTIAGNIRFENTAMFTESKEDGYQLIWEDSLIVPELEKTDKISILETKAMRGKILDRNGYMLAGEGSAYSVGVVPGKLDGETGLEGLAALLGMEVETIQTKLNASWVKDDLFVPLRTLSKETEQEIEAQLLEIPGVLIQTEVVRSYPLEEAAAHLVGYIQNVTAEDLEEHKGEGYSSTSKIGKSGMEALYEKELKGENGYTIRILSKDGKVKDILAQAEVKHGKDIKLTIDSSLQKELYNTFKEDESCSVAINPETGEVLALVSTPTYDNNDFVLGMSTEQWNTLNNDESMPLMNRFRKAYAPGSAFKPITAAIGLEMGAFTADENFGNEGLSWQKDNSWGSYKVTTLKAYEPVVLKNAIMYSDNIYFAKAALKIGAGSFENALNKLGFNETLPFEIIMNQSQYANTEHIETEILLADSGYGQGEILINPLHLATIYTAFTNEGNVIKPTLLYEENKTANIWIESAFSKEVAETVLDGMKMVVNNPNGTAYAAYREDVILAGKTGTAELKASKGDTSGTELGWFVVTTTKDTEKPILIASMVEDVKGIGGSGYVVRKNATVLNEWFQ